MSRINKIALATLALLWVVWLASKNKLKDFLNLAGEKKPEQSDLMR